MKNQPKKTSSATPLIIIGLVLIIALGGGFLLYRSSNDPVKPTRTPTPAGSKTPDSAAQRYANAPQGAEPPHMLGSPTSTVTVEEFADFQCPQCAAKFPMAKEIISTYGNRIKFVYRNFPLNIPAHDKAYTAAVAAEAAGLQNKFWDMQYQLFTNQQSWTASNDFSSVLEEYAQKIGLDVEKFKNDMAGLQTKQRVDLDLARGRAVGVNSTPSFFVNGKLIPFEQVEITAMRQIIDAELLKAPTPAQTAPTTEATTAPTTSPVNTAANKTSPNKTNK